MIAWSPWAICDDSAKGRRRDGARSCFGSSCFSLCTCCSFRDMVWNCWKRTRYTGMCLRRSCQKFWDVQIVAKWGSSFVEPVVTHSRSTSVTVNGGSATGKNLLCGAIPAIALQKTIETDIRTLPYFVQKSATSVDENRVVVWNELDMTSAFYVLRLEPAWNKFRALAKPVSGQFVCEPTKASTLQWQSEPWNKSQQAISCNKFAGSFASYRSPWKVGPIKRGSARLSFSAKRKATWNELLQRVLEKFSHAKLKHWNQLSHPERKI